MFNIQQFKWRDFWNLFSLNLNDPRNFDKYNSVASMLLERERHRTYHKYTIHPFSRFRVFWETFYIGYMVMSISISFATINVTYFSTMHHFEFHIIFFTYIPMLLNIIFNFRTGFFKDREEAILNFSSIWRHYGKFLFIFDIFGLIFGSPLIRYVHRITYLPMRHYFSFLLLNNIGIFSGSVTPIVYWKKRISKYVLWSNVVSNIVGYLLFFPLIILFLSSIAYYVECNLENACKHLQYKNATRTDAINKFMNLFIKIISDSPVFKFNTNYPLLLVFNIVSIFVSYLRYFLVTTFLILLFWAERGPADKYNDLIDNLQEYLRLKKIPERLKMRITKYYEETYRGKFYHEPDLLDLFSSELKEDIVALKLSKLREQITILGLIPIEELIIVSRYLVFEVFFGNDVICYSGTPHDRMYFVARGSVAVFTDSAKEIYHVANSMHFLENGIDPATPPTRLNYLACETTVLYSLSRTDYINVKDECPVFDDLLNSSLNISYEIVKFIKDKDDAEDYEPH